MKNEKNTAQFSTLEFKGPKIGVFKINAFRSFEIYWPKAVEIGN